MLSISSICKYDYKGAVILAFFTFWGITTHPLHPKGPRIWKLAKKNSTSSLACENFWQKPEKAFFGIVSTFNFRNTVWQIFTIFSACFIYIFNIHSKIYVSQSKTVVTREWLRKGSKYICLQNLESKLNVTKIFLETYPIYYVLGMEFKPSETFSFQTVFLFTLKDDCNKNWIFCFPSQYWPLNIKISQIS